MRFFVAEGAPQNDGGFVEWAAGRRPWQSHGWGVWVEWAASEKRWQIHRSPKVLGGAIVSEVGCCGAIGFFGSLAAIGAGACSSWWAGRWSMDEILRRGRRSSE
jgi:hypothetical protein